MGNVLKCLKSDYEVLSQDDSEDIINSLRINSERITELEQADCLLNKKFTIEIRNIKKDILELSDRYRIIEMQLQDVAQIKKEIKKTNDKTNLIRRQFDNMGSAFNQFDMSICEENSF